MSFNFVGKVYLFSTSVEKVSLLSTLLKSGQNVCCGQNVVVNLDYFETTSSSASASAYVPVPTVSTTYTVEATAVLGVLMLTYDHDGTYNIIIISNNKDKGAHFHGRHQHHHQHNHQHNHFNEFAACPSTDSSGPSIDRVSSFITRS